MTHEHESRRATESTVLEHASLVGAFNPRGVVAAFGGSPEATLALESLAERCDEVVTGDQVLWTMVPDSRRRVLASLHAEGRLQAVAEHSEQLPLWPPSEADRLGELLQRAVLKKPIVTTDMTMEQLGELRVALQFVSSAVASEPNVDVDTLLARRETSANLNMLLPTPLIGREHELARLVEFATQKTRSAALPLIRLQGNGGTGKSALLAAFVKSLGGDDSSGVPIVWLDFDRAALAAADPMMMIFEITRQLAIYRPHLGERFAEFRRRAREVLASDIGSSRSEYESKASSITTIWSIWRSALTGTTVDEPIVLILDTFEEITVQGPHAVHQVARFLASLAFEGDVSGLRAILSGRTVPDTILGVMLDTEAGTVLLDALPAQNATELLSACLVHLQQDPEALPLRALAEKFGGNPLVLKILARHLAREGAVAAQDLLRSPDVTRSDARVVQGYLYTRILGRLRDDDPDLVRVAHPGLVLRRVTASLIQHVLAAPCGLQGVDLARARTLFEKLSRQIWLVEPGDRPEVVHHRRDLRRIVLGMMEGDASRGVPTIHRLAAAYYRDRQDPFIDDRKQCFESFYHELMDPKSSAYPLPADVHDFVAYLGEDLENVPIARRARLKLEAERALTEDERYALDQVERGRYVTRVVSSQQAAGELDVRLGGVVVAAAGTTRGSSDVEGHASWSDLAVHEAIQAHFARADFEAVLARMSDAIDEHFTESSEASRARERLPEDFTQRSLWRVALASLAVSEEDHLSSQLTLAIDRRRINWERRAHPGREDSISLGVATATVLALIGRPSPNVRVSRDRYARRPIRTLERFRAYRLLDATSADAAGYDLSGRTQVALDLLNDLSPAVVRGIEGSVSYESIQFSSVRRRLPKSNATLADVQRASGSDANAVVSLWAARTSEERRIQRGRVSDIHLALRGFIQPMATSICAEFAEQAAQQIDWWPVELRPDELAASLKRDPSRWTATFFDVLDRCGLLSRFMVSNSRHLAVTRRYGGISNLLTEYDRRLRGEPPSWTLP